MKRYEIEDEIQGRDMWEGETAIWGEGGRESKSLSEVKYYLQVLCMLPTASGGGGKHAVMENV